MNSDKDILPTIDLYLEGKLSEAELAEIENIIASDQSFAKEVAITKLVNELCFDQGLVELKQKMVQYEKVQQINQKKIKFGLAALALLAVLSAGWMYIAHKPKNQPLASKYAVAKNSKQEELATTHENAQNSVVEKAKEKFSEHTNTIQKEIPIASSKENIEAIETKAKSLETATKPVVQEAADEKTRIPEGKITLPTEVIKPAPSKVKEKPDQMLVEESVAPTETKITKPQTIAISYSAGEAWSLPIDAGTDAAIIIVDRGGRTVFHTKIVAGYPNEWSGQTDTGEPIALGQYLYVIEYADGKKQQGYITVTR